MASILLWNVNGRSTLDGLAEALVLQEGIEIALFVEYDSARSELPVLLGRTGFVRMPSPDRFGVFFLPPHRLERLSYRVGNRAVLCEWTAPSGSLGILGLVHGPDRRNHGDDARRVYFRSVADAARRCERKRKHARTIIAGDFNAHPFKSAVASVDGLNAVGIRSGRFPAAVGREHDSYYNPCWRLYGQAADHDAGAATHWWVPTGGFGLGWHLLDQVVIRPGELPRFPESRLRIITQIGGMSLLDADGRPDASSGSDHLPLAFDWNL